MDEAAIKKSSEGRTLREKWLDPATVALFLLMMGGGSGFFLIMLNRATTQIQFSAWLALWLGYIVLAVAIMVKRHLKLTAKVGPDGGEGGLEVGDVQGDGGGS